MTGDDVRAVLFGRPPFGKRGYREDDVDAFLDRAAAALDDRAAGRPVQLSAADVAEVTFRRPGIGKRGYLEDEVDAFLDHLAAALGGGGPATTPEGRPLQP